RKVARRLAWFVRRLLAKAGSTGSASHRPGAAVRRIVPAAGAAARIVSSDGHDMDVLTIADAKKKFGTVVALDGATLSLRAGELLALLGPNGAGKTTLIRAIAARLQLDAGEILLFGR